MPRLDHRVTVADLLSYQEQMVLTIVVEHLNVLRVQVGLPALTAQDLRQAVRAWVQAHPRNEAH
jgi:hypothetical protein